MAVKVTKGASIPQEVAFVAYHRDNEVSALVERQRIESPYVRDWAARNPKDDIIFGPDAVFYNDVMTFVRRLVPHSSVQKPKLVVGNIGDYIALREQFELVDEAFPFQIEPIHMPSFIEVMGFGSGLSSMSQRMSAVRTGLEKRDLLEAARTLLQVFICAGTPATAVIPSDPDRIDRLSTPMRPSKSGTKMGMAVVIPPQPSVPASVHMEQPSWNRRELTAANHRLTPVPPSIGVRRPSQPQHAVEHLGPQPSRSRTVYGMPAVVTEVGVKKDPRAD